MASTTDNIKVNHGVTYNKELGIPSYATETELNAYTPAGNSAIAQVPGVGFYHWDSSASVWVKNSDTENTGGSTYRGTLDDILGTSTT